MAEKTDAERRKTAQDIVREMRIMQGLEEREPAIEKEEPLPPPVQWSWRDYSSWPLFVRFAPAYVALLGIFIAVYYQNFVMDEGLDMTSWESCQDTFNYTFRINAARHQAEEFSERSWEIGTAAEASVELLNPERSVFAANPFPDGKIPPQGLHLEKASVWAYPKINKTSDTLFADEYSVSDPASLGVIAVMVGQRWEEFLQAADRQKDYLLKTAKRYSNGAISHRVEVPELWSDAISMVPPFLAYLGVANNDLELLREAVRQCELYREVLQITSGPKKGLWKHIVGPSGKADDGAWSTGNAWAAYGMARVRATISGWNPSNSTMTSEINKLDQWIGEIIDGAIRTDNDESGLLRNYLGDDSWFGETSGTALLTAATYRMAVFKPEVFGQPKYELWAHKKRQAVLDTVDDDGIPSPMVNPLQHDSREPVRESGEGESFLLTLAAAWRDCVCAGVCTSATQERY